MTRDMAAGGRRNLYHREKMMSMTVADAPEDRDLCATVSDEDMINEIFAFCDHGVDNRDLLTLQEYKADTQRLIGHQPGIARAKLANRQARQVSHMCAGLAQFLARRYAPGIRDDGDLDKVEAALARVFMMMIDRGKYDIGDIYLKWNLVEGMQPCYGGLITDVDVKYPEAWAFFQTPEGQSLCCTEAEWQAMTHAVWHTNADGSQVGWNGIGGAPKFVFDVTNKTLRMPDLRGMVPECTGGPDSPGVGQAKGDGIRGFGGWIGYFCESVVWNEISQGIIETETLSHPDFAPQIANPGNGDYNYTRFNLAPKRQIPVFSVNRMRSWGSLVCAYLGQPGS